MSVYIEMCVCVCAHIYVCFSSKVCSLYIRDVLQRDTETLRIVCHSSTKRSPVVFTLLLSPSLSFSAHSILFCLPNIILDRLLLSSLATCCLVPEVLINNLWEAKIVISKCIETHWLPAAVVGDISFQRHTWLIPWKFSWGTCNYTLQW